MDEDVRGVLSIVRKLDLWRVSHKIYFWQLIGKRIHARETNNISRKFLPCHANRDTKKTDWNFDWNQEFCSFFTELSTRSWNISLHKTIKNL